MIPVQTTTWAEREPELFIGRRKSDRDRRQGDRRQGDRRRGDRRRGHAAPLNLAFWSR